MFFLFSLVNLLKLNEMQKLSIIAAGEEANDHFLEIIVTICKGKLFCINSYTQVKVTSSQFDDRNGTVDAIKMAGEEKFAYILLKNVCFFLFIVKNFTFLSFIFTFLSFNAWQKRQQ